jgi:predicted HTH domain antitoxin
MGFVLDGRGARISWLMSRAMQGGGMRRGEVRSAFAVELFSQGACAVRGFVDAATP